MKKDIRNSRLTPADRKAEILEAAIRVATNQNYATMHRQDVAAKAGCTAPLVTRYFGSMHELRKAVIKEAVKREVLPIIAQGLIVKDKYCSRLPADVKERALATV